MADTVADAHLRLLGLITKDLVSLAEAMPADRYEFRPTAGAFTDVRTFSEQVRHAATMIFMTAAHRDAREITLRPGANDNGPATVQGKQQILEYLNASIVYARKAMSSLTAKNHLDPLKTCFGSQPRMDLRDACEMTA